MISLFSHRPPLRVMKLLRDTKDNALDATTMSLGACPLIRAGEHRRAVVAGWFWGGADVAFRIPSLSRTAADVDGIPSRNSMSFWFIFSFFFFLMAMAWDSADLIISNSSLCEDFCCCFAFGGGPSIIAIGKAAPPGVVGWDVDELVIRHDIFPTGRPTAQ